MLCNGSNRCNHPKSGALRNVFQLYKRILKRAVSVNTNQNCPSSVAAHHTQPVNYHSRNSTGIRWHGNNRHIILRHRDRAEVLPAIGQIDGNGIPIQRPSHKARHLPCSARRAKHHFEYAHQGTLPYACRHTKSPTCLDRVYGTREHPPCTNPMLSAHGLHNSRCRLHIFTEYRCVLLRYPIPDRAKNGVFCNVAASAPPRVSKTAGHCIILSPDIARMTHLCSRKRQNLTQTAR